MHRVIVKSQVTSPSIVRMHYFLKRVNRIRTIDHVVFVATIQDKIDTNDNTHCDHQGKIALLMTSLIELILPTL